MARIDVYRWAHDPEGQGFTGHPRSELFTTYDSAVVPRVGETVTFPNRPDVDGVVTRVNHEIAAVTVVQVFFR